MNESNSQLPASPAPRLRKPATVIDFTVENIEAINPPTHADRVAYKDTKEQGLYLRVTRTGAKTFTYVGRAKGAARVERITIGKFPIVKPAEARKRARELSGHQAGGASVSAEGRSRRHEMTLADLWSKYYEHQKAKAKKPATSLLAWTTYIGPKYGARKLSDLEFSELERWHGELPGIVMARRQEMINRANAAKQEKRLEIEARRKIRRHGPDPKPVIKTEVDSTQPPHFTGKTQANRCIEVIRAMYNFALHPQRELYSGRNPASQHKLYEENERDRFLQADELGKFFAALAAIPSETMRDAILTSLLAAARKSNILSMKWDDLNLERKVWTLHGQLQKNKKPYTVPLVPELVELLKRREAKQADFLANNPPKTKHEKLCATFVFPSAGSKTGHIIGLARAWASLKRTANIKDIRIHDLRRTMGSWQAKTGASLIVIGKSLNHQDSAATKIYARLDLDPVRDSMTTASSAMFEAAGLKPKGEVIDLPTRKTASGQGKKAG